MGTTNQAEADHTQGVDEHAAEKEVEEVAHGENIDDQDAIAAVEAAQVEDETGI